VYGPVPADASVAVKVHFCPLSMNSEDADTSDATRAGFTVAVAVVDWVEETPELSLATTVMAYVPISEGEKSNVGVLVVVLATPSTYQV